jgi:hypothetical protein
MILLEFHMGISFVSVLTQWHTIRFCMGKSSEKFRHIFLQIIRLPVFAVTILPIFVQSHFTPVNAVNTT